MALDKESKTLGKKQYHIHLKPGDIGKYVLLPGDPARSDRVAKYLDNAELVANNREHRTFTGYYKGVRVSVTSTGMGCPVCSDRSRGADEHWCRVPDPNRKQCGTAGWNQHRTSDDFHRLHEK